MLRAPAAAPARPSFPAARRVRICYPSGNPTALVVADALPSAAQTRVISDALVSHPVRELFPHATRDVVIEQGGFLLPPRAPSSLGRLEMFGGEFCGNALRSAVRVLTQGAPQDGWVESSGASRPLAFEIADDGHVTTQMPLASTDDAALPLASPLADGYLVRLEGITHRVWFNPGAAIWGLDDAGLRAHAEREMQTFAELRAAPACGVVYYDRERAAARFVVWVHALQTCFVETACGSGTCAAGIALATLRRASIDLAVLQPSGNNITVAAHFDEERQRITRATISGPVEILADGELRVDAT